MTPSSTSPESNILYTQYLKPRYFLLAGLALILLWLLVAGLRIGGHLLSLQAYEAEARTLMAGGLRNVDPDAAEALVRGIHRDVAGLKTETRPFLFVGSFFGWLPRVGPALTAAPHLMEMANAGSEGAVYAIAGLKPGLSILQQSDAGAESRLPALIQAVHAAQTDLAGAAQAIDRAAAARAKLGDTETLPWRVRVLLEQADEWLPVAQAGLKVAQVMPALMGVEGQQTYVILVQNNDELRATGGFISSAGLLVVENGHIINFDFRDSYTVDNFDKPYDFPPQPLYDFMLTEGLGFRDANFWPDFPTSAEKTMTLFTYGQDIPLDGAIAIDQEFVRLLVGALGPIDLPDSDRPITGQNVIGAMRAAWQLQDEQLAEDWLAERKSFIGDLAVIIRTRLESDPASVDLPKLVSALYTAAAGKHLQIYMRDSEVAAVMAQNGWDGRLSNSMGQDALMVVDSNVGFNKVNAVVESSLLYQVALSPDGGGQASLAVTYTHPGPETNPLCRHSEISYRPGIVYNDLITDCYWNYLRLYAPAGSALLEASSHHVPGESLLSGRPWEGQAHVASPENNGSLEFTAFANLLLVPEQQTITSHFTYQLPHPASRKTGAHYVYDLTVYKQAGARPQPLEIIITLPEGARFIEAEPPPTAVSGQTVIFSTSLDKDSSFKVTYRQ